MRLTAALFDLDGTLLPMDQDQFTKFYFKLLAQKMAPRGYAPDALIDCVWAGTAAMVKNDGSRTNEEAFWDRFAQSYGKKAQTDRPLFEEFYRVEFQQARQVCGRNPKAAEAVMLAKELGLRVALATNPLFPRFATESRVRWAGLTPETFECCTAYEDSRYCKPNLNYYRELLDRMNLRPEACIMVGNDVDEDMIASRLGMQVFLLTDCLVNRGGRDLSAWPHGDFDALAAHLRALSA